MPSKSYPIYAIFPGTSGQAANVSAIVRSAVGVQLMTIPAGSYVERTGGDSNGAGVYFGGGLSVDVSLLPIAIETTIANTPGMGIETLGFDAAAQNAVYMPLAATAAVLPTNFSAMLVTPTGYVYAVDQNGNQLANHADVLTLENLVAAITTNTVLAQLVCPQTFIIPANGTQPNVITLDIKTAGGIPQAPDALPTFVAANAAGVSRTSQLGTVTSTGDTGGYQVTYTTSQADVIEELTITAHWAVGGVQNRIRVATATGYSFATDFTASDRIVLGNIPTSVWTNSTRTLTSTQSFNNTGQTTPLLANDVNGNALATAAALATALTTILQAIAAGSGSGPGANKCTLTIDSNGVPIPSAVVYVTSDAAGDIPVAGPLITNSNGQVAAMLTAGQTYYLFMQATGQNPIEGASFVAVAD